MFDKPTADGGGAPSAPSRPLSTQRRLDVFNLIWIETSHAVIHAYRARLAEMDKQIASSAPPPRRPRDQAPGSRTGAPGPTARRRLVHSFRAFLGAEEDFYRSIAARLARDLSDRDLAGLRAVGITPALAVPSQNAANAGHGRFERDDPAAAREMDMDVAAHDAHATRRERRELALPLVHKALIYFGDLARYRELYNEPQPPMQPKHPGGGRKGNKQQQQQAQPQEKRQKNWARAAECYHQARLLIPDQGNPSNQLAVLSAYAGDSLSSTYHYYRALTVRSPFPTARTNLDNSYSKAIDKYFSSQALQQSAQGEDGADATQLKEAFIALHGIFFTGKHLADLQTVSTRVDELLKPCVEQRLLTSETLVKIIVTALCSLWNARMFRSGTNDGAAAASSKRAPPPAPAKDMPNLEPEIVMHVLSLFRTLLDVAAAETTEPVDSVANGDEDMSLRISAVLRRMLPPLRIFSKWLMGQLDYISRTELRLQAREVKQQRAADSGIDKGQDKPALATATAFQESMRAFWDAYAALATGLRRAFSIERMPAVVTDAIVWLEEDVDMLGFSPLRRRAGKDGPLAVFDAARAEEAGAERGAQVQSNAHPNEEQLMRIRDLQEDALVLAQSEVRDEWANKSHSRQCADRDLFDRHSLARKFNCGMASMSTTRPRRRRTTRASSTTRTSRLLVRASQRPSTCPNLLSSRHLTSARSTTRMTCIWRSSTRTRRYRPRTTRSSLRCVSRPRVTQVSRITRTRVMTRRSRSSTVPRRRHAQPTRRLLVAPRIQAACRRRIHSKLSSVVRMRLTSSTRSSQAPSPTLVPAPRVPLPPRRARQLADAQSGRQLTLRRRLVWAHLTRTLQHATPSLSPSAT